MIELFTNLPDNIELSFDKAAGWLSTKNTKLRKNLNKVEEMYT